MTAWEAQLLSDYLAERGYKVTRAEDGIAALIQLKRDPLPDIVLLDMNSLVSTALRRSHRFAQTIVLRT